MKHQVQARSWNHTCTRARASELPPHSIAWQPGAERGMARLRFHGVLLVAEHQADAAV